MSEADRFALVPTRHGALALRDAQAGEVMHPGLGPAAEADALYLRGSELAARLARADPAPLVLFDVGLGAGSNAARAMALHASLAAPRALELVSFEHDLAAFAYALAHPEAFAAPPGAQELLAQGVCRAPGVTWELRAGDALESLEALAREPRRAEVIFWDPFSQVANPGLWTVAAFAAARAATGPDAVLVTYSSSTTARTALLLAGWFVGEGPVLEAGRRTTVAATSRGTIGEPLKAAWLGRRARSTAPWPADAGADADARLRAHPQFA